MNHLDQLLDMLGRMDRRLLLGSGELESLTLPQHRVWFQGCREYVRQTTDHGRSSCDLDDLLPFFGPANSFARHIAEAHVRVAKAMQDWPLAPGSWRTDELDFSKAGSATSESAAALPLGFCVDLAHELSPHLHDRSETTLTATGGLLCGPIRPAAHTIAVPVLLVRHVPDRSNAPSRSEGVCARLVIEWVNGGRGDFYRVPALAFVQCDRDFRLGLLHARAFLKRHGIWPTNADLRWRLLLPRKGLTRDGWVARSEGSLDFPLDGPSAGAQLALALVALVGIAQPEAVLPFPDIRGLDLSRFVLTARFHSRHGTLHPVGGLYDKLIAAARDSLPPLHRVVTSEDPAVKPEQEACRQRPTGVQVETAPTLPTAVRKMALEQPSRWRAYSPPELPPHNIPRARFVEHVLGWIGRTPAGYLVVWGGMGRGKTTAMAQLLRELRNRGHGPVFHFLTQDLDDPLTVARSLFRQLCLKYPDLAPDQPAPGKEDYELRDLLGRVSAERLRADPDAREVLLIDAADQVKLDGEAGGQGLKRLIVGALKELPPGVVCVVTSRFDKRWQRWSSQMEDEEFRAPLVDDRQDIGRYLAARSQELATPLSDALVARIVEGGSGPIFKTIVDRLRTLESPPPASASARERQAWTGLQQELREQPGLWLMEPETLVREALERVVELAAETPTPLLGERVWELLNLVALADDGERSFSEQQWRELGLWDDGMAKVLRLAGSLFRRRPDPAPLLPYVFDHPGNKRAILADPTTGQPRVDPTAIHKLLAERLRDRWRRTGGLEAEGPTSDLAGYALRHLPRHWREAECWDQLVGLLWDLEFVEARCQASQVAAMMADYEAALESLPECRAEAAQRRAERQRIERWVEELTAFARGERTTCPEVPASAPLKTDEEIERECERVVKAPTRRDRLEAFAIFVGTQSHQLAEFGQKPGFCVQQSANYAPGGPVRGAALKRLAERPVACLLREYPMEAEYQPRPACLRTLAGHSDRVESVSVSADGRRAVSGSWDKTVRVWDLEGGQCLRTLEGHTDRVTSVSLSADGRRAVSGSNDNTLRVWDLESGRCLRTLEGHTSVVFSVSVSADGRRAVSGGTWDQPVRVWDLESGQRLRDFQGHSHHVMSVSVSADGRRAVSGSRDNTVRVWDLESSQCRRNLKGHTKGVWSVSVSADGRRAVSGSLDRTVRVWDLESGQCQRTLHGHTNGVTSVSASADGRRAVSGSKDETLRVWDLESGECLRTLVGHTHDVSSVSVSADGRRAVSGSHDRTVRVWDLESGQSVRALAVYWNPFLSVSVSADGRRAVSGSEDKTLWVWDRESSQCWRNLEGHAKAVWSVSVSADGRWAVSGSEDKTLRVWDLESGECLRVLAGHTDWVRSVSVSADGRRAVSGSEDQTVRVWDLESGACLAIFAAEAPVHAAAASQDTSAIVCGTSTGEVIFLRWCDSKAAIQRILRRPARKPRWL